MPKEGNDARQNTIIYQNKDALAIATLQGNKFNGIKQLVRTDSSGKLPAIDGSQLTNLPPAAPTPYIVHSIDDTDSPYTITETSGEIVILADATAGAITINLPTTVGNTAKYNIKKIDASANIVTVDAFSTETIDGVPTLGLGTVNAASTLMTDDIKWFKF